MLRNVSSCFLRSTRASFTPAPLVVSSTRGMFDGLADALNKAGGTEKIKQLMVKTYEAQSTDSLVTIVIKGDDNVESVRISPELLQKGSTIVEGSVKEAINSAMKKKQLAMVAEYFKGGGSIPDPSALQ